MRLTKKGCHVNIHHNCDKFDLKKGVDWLERRWACTKLLARSRTMISALRTVKSVVALDLNDVLNSHQGGVNSKQRIPELKAGKVGLERPRLDFTRVIYCN